MVKRRRNRWISGGLYGRRNPYGMAMPRRFYGIVESEGVAEWYSRTASIIELGQPMVIVWLPRSAEGREWCRADHLDRSGTTARPVAAPSAVFNRHTRPLTAADRSEWVGGATAEEVSMGFWWRHAPPPNCSMSVSHIPIRGSVSYSQTHIRVRSCGVAPPSFRSVFWNLREYCGWWVVRWTRLPGVGLPALWLPGFRDATGAPSTVTRLSAKTRLHVTQNNQPGCHDHHVITLPNTCGYATKISAFPSPIYISIMTDCNA